MPPTFMRARKAIYLDHVINPAQEFSNFGVNSRVVGLSAARTPAHDTHQPPHVFILAHQRTPAVPLHTQRVDTNIQ